MFEYTPQGVCSKKINYEIKDGIIHNVKFTGGCDGNLQGLSRLLEGMSADEAIERLKGIRCGRKKTSCPDQLTKALEKSLKSQRV